MYNHQLLPGEEIIVQTEYGIITLTTHRIRYNDSSGNGKITSIMLENVSGIEVQYRSWLAALIGGLVALIIGLSESIINKTEESIVAGGLIVALIGVVLIIAYLVSRRYIINIHSNGKATVSFMIKGLRKEEIISLIDKVESAQNERYLIKDRAI